MSSGSAQVRSGSGSGPVLGLLARGLELWLRQQCESIEAVQIQLEGNAAQLLIGRLDAVNLRARGVVFQRLEIERVELRSTPLRVRMGRLLRGQSLQLEDPFHIQGSVAFSAEGLSRSLGQTPWSQIGDDLAEKLLGLAPLSGLRFEGEQVILRSLAVNGSQPLERVTQVEIEAGGLVLRAIPDPSHTMDPATDTGEVRLPRDPGIEIERAELGGGLLELHGRARVSP
jgi:hypothetical protein